MNVNDVFEIEDILYVICKATRFKKTYYFIRKVKDIPIE